MDHMQKHSSKRDAILACIRGTGSHPTAEWVYQQLKPTIPDLSLATVYRNLNLFRSQGLVASVGTVRGQERFDGTTEPHTHFICDRCAAVLDLPGITIPGGLKQAAQEELSCIISGAALTFTGLCPACRNSAQEETV